MKGEGEGENLFCFLYTYAFHRTFNHNHPKASAYYREPEIEIKRETFSGISVLTDLTNLRLSFVMKDNVLYWISALTNLRVLNIEGFSGMRTVDEE